MDEPTLEQQADVCATESADFRIAGWPARADALAAAAATIRRHAELVRLCREWQAVKDVPYEWASPEYERYDAAEAALVAAIGKEP